MSEALLAGGILCPIDLAAPSAPALRLAAAIADGCGTTLTVVHTLESEVPAYFTPGGAERIEGELERERSAARQQAARLLQEILPGQRADIRVEEGHPQTVIQRLAGSLGASMIVMGTHARSGLERIAKGSVAEEVLHASAIPVLTVGPADRASPTAPIICAVTDSELSRKALSLAAALAECLGRRLVVVHVAAADEPRKISNLCDWVRQERRPACELQEITRHGQPAREILALAGELGAGLLVTGAVHKFLSERTALGATAEKLLRESPCPVLTVLGDKNVVPTDIH